MAQPFLAVSVANYEICFFSSARRFRASRGLSWSRSASRSLSRTARSSGVKRIAWAAVAVGGGFDGAGG